VRTAKKKKMTKPGEAVLEYLRKTEAPVGLSEVVRETGVASGSAYGILQRLVAAGVLHKSLDALYSLVKPEPEKVEAPTPEIFVKDVVDVALAEAAPVNALADTERTLALLGKRKAVVRKELDGKAALQREHDDIERQEAILTRTVAELRGKGEAQPKTMTAGSSLPHA
jgi:hypothetical protein